MKKHILFTLLILLSSITGSITFSQKNNQWTGTDALGRKLDDNFEVGSLKKNKYVGMFYWTWHTDGNATYPLYDITQILKQNPEAESQVDHPAWGGISEGGIYWWDQPLFGYYRTTDEWVLRKHAEMLADAGVDVVFFDCSNGSISWKTSYTVLLKVWAEARSQGVKTPQIAFLLPFSASSDAITTMSELFTDLYLPHKYQDLWFMWDNKPLIMAYPEMTPQPVNTAGMKFTASSNFTSINVSCPSWANNIGNISLSLYKWLGTYNQSVSAAPISTETFQNFTDNSKLALNFNPQIAGDYVWELKYGTELVGVWKWTDSQDNNVVSYFNGSPVSGNYESEILYTSNQAFTMLTNGTAAVPIQVFGNGISQARIDSIKSFFTFRPGQPDYVAGPSRNDQWGWLEVAPQHGYGLKTDGTYEQTTVGVAQNASDNSGGHASAFNSPTTYGRSYTKLNGQDNRDQAYLYGLNFQEQWNNAIKMNPEFVFVTGWNEWTAGRWFSWDVKPFSFVDEYSAEKSRDIEPVKSWGKNGDVYYMQLVNNIRQYKGIDLPDTTSGYKTINLTNISDWNNVKPHYTSNKGNVLPRNHAGQGTALQYVNNTGRNDIVSSKTTRDSENIYFYVETDQNLSPVTDAKWMRLFIDIDRNKATGWEGYDYVINRLNPTDSALIERSTSDSWSWTKTGNAAYSVNGKYLVLKVKKTALALTNTEPLNFEFKWSDNMQEDGNIMDFYVNGDVAPAGRFNYIYKETENSDGYLLPYNPTNVNKGLKCQIYNQYFDTIPEFDNFKADSTNFPLKPDLPVLTNSFGVQYKSYIDIAQTGNYRFTLSSNSKAQIIINNKKLVKSDGSTAFSGEAKLLKGKHQLILQYISKPNSQQNLQLTVQNTQLNSTLPDTIFYKKNVNPTCSFTLNGNQRYYSSIDSVVTVNAQDVDGKIAKIELFDGNQLFYQTQQKSKISGVGFGVGDHNVYARIYDNDGAVIDTKSISFTVKDPFQTPGKMIMEDYANGESISIISSNDTDGGKSIKSGYGFAEYYINVPQNGIYSVSFRVPASTSGTKKINIYFDNVSAGSVSVGAVGNTYPWYSVSKECSLTSGIHKMRLSFSGIVTIHYVDFSFVTAIDETAQTNLTVNYNEDLNNLSIISPIEIVSVRIANMLGENVQVIAPASNTNRMYLKCEIPTGIYVLTVNLYNGARKEIKFIKK